MAKRMILMLGVMATLLTALGFMKFKQIQTAVQLLPISRLLRP